MYTCRRSSCSSVSSDGTRGAGAGGGRGAGAGGGRGAGAGASAGASAGVGGWKWVPNMFMKPSISCEWAVAPAGAFWRLWKVGGGGLGGRGDGSLSSSSQAPGRCLLYGTVSNSGSNCRFLLTRPNTSDFFFCKINEYNVHVHVYVYGVFFVLINVLFNVH